MDIAGPILLGIALAIGIIGGTDHALGHRVPFLSAIWDVLRRPADTATNWLGRRRARRY